MSIGRPRLPRAVCARPGCGQLVKQARDRYCCRSCFLALHGLQGPPLQPSFRPYVALLELEVLGVAVRYPVASKAAHVRLLRDIRLGRLGPARIAGRLTVDEAEGDDPTPLRLAA